MSTTNIISETRAADQSLQLTQFASGSKVAIFLAEDVNGTATASGDNVTTYTQPLEYTADGNGGLSTADNSKQYWPTSGNGLHIYGVYPYSAATAYDATNVPFSVKGDQSSDADYNASDLMTGAPETNPAKRTDNNGAVEVKFTHLLSKININLTAGAGFETADLSSAKVYIQNTKPTTTFNVQNTTLGTASGTAADITVCTGTKGSAIIVPQTVASGTAFIKVEVGGGEYIYKLGSETTFAGKTQYTYNITVAKTGLTVKSTISAWTSAGDAISGTASLESIPYVTFSATSEQVFTMKVPTGTDTSIGPFEYSVGGGEWTTVTSEAEVTFGGDNGDLQLRGQSEVGTAAVVTRTYGSDYTSITISSSTISFTNSSVSVAASGDIRTLVDYKNYKTVSTANARFKSLFKGCTALTSAPDLPATTLVEECYSGMFSGCTSLTEAPDLPATELAEQCYYGMFNGCTALTTAPTKLPATELAEKCYYNMFKGCTSLTTAPEIEATTLATQSCYQMFYNCSALTTAPTELSATALAEQCYYQMFYYCTSLTAAPQIKAETLASECCYQMFYNCKALETAPKLEATNLAENCYQQMFRGCTNLTTVYELPATTLASRCYDQMFYGCTKLETAPEIKAETLGSYSCYRMFYQCTALKNVPALSATTLASYCYYEMFYYCTSLEKAPALSSATTLAESCYLRMFFGCSSLTEAPELPATMLAKSCYTGMFSGCTSLTAAPKLEATNLAEYCYQQMFLGCTSLETAPELPATTLKEYCYYYMFQNCTNLKEVTIKAESTAVYALSYWLDNVAPSGTIKKKSSFELPSGVSGIPSGWTTEDI